MTAITKAMVLAAGFGTRLRPLTNTIPKPLIPVGGRPIIDHTLDKLAQAGVKTCVVNTHHLAQQVQDHLSPRRSPHIIISHEDEILETGGGLCQALPHLGPNPFFSVNSDAWWEDGPVSALTCLSQAWDPEHMDFLLLIVPCKNTLGYTGVGDFDHHPDGRLTFRTDLRSEYIYTGLQIIHPRVFETCAVERFSVADLWRKADKNQRLFGLIHQKRWGDMGTQKGLRCVENYS